MEKIRYKGVFKLFFQAIKSVFANFAAVISIVLITIVLPVVIALILNVEISFKIGISSYFLFTLVAYIIAVGAYIKLFCERNSIEDKKRFGIKVAFKYGVFKSPKILLTSIFLIILSNFISLIIIKFLNSAYTHTSMILTILCITLILLMSFLISFWQIYIINNENMKLIETFKLVLLTFKNNWIDIIRKSLFSGILVIILMSIIVTAIIMIVVLGLATGIITPIAYIPIALLIVLSFSIPLSIAFNIAMLKGYGLI